MSTPSVSPRTLAGAALDDDERRVLERFVEAVREEYGEELAAIWLYGARARGEREHDESDVDILVVTHHGISDEPLSRLLYDVPDELGVPGVILDPRQRSVEWIRDRRSIRSFFLQEVDRDRIVLYGHGMSARSRELFERAREGLASAGTLISAGHAATAVSTAYYAMIYAARAALSERDINGRTHSGTWQLFGKTFVDTGQFDPALATLARKSQARREASDYGAEVFELGEGRDILDVAERFVAAVGGLLEAGE